MAKVIKVTFDESIEVINEEISKKRGKWTLTAVQWMDFEDISQILRIHIHKKWHMWDQARPIRPWLHKIITNQIHNLIRNNYSNHARPCLRCAAAEEGNLCSIFTTQCSACPLYANWMKYKKNAHDVKLPVNLDFHLNELSQQPDANFDIEHGIGLVHKKMKEILKPVEYQVYESLYIKGESEEDVANYLGFKTTEVGRSKGYRQICNIKDSIIEKAKKLLDNGEIDF